MSQMNMSITTTMNIKINQIITIISMVKIASMNIIIVMKKN